MVSFPLLLWQRSTNKYVKSYSFPQLALAGAVDVDIAYEAKDSGSIPHYPDFRHSFSLKCKIRITSCK